MDELTRRAQALLDHPPVAPRSMDQLRARADRTHRRRVRRQRLAGAVVALVVAVGLYAGFARGARSGHEIKVVVPPVTTPSTGTGPTTTTTTPSAAGYLAPRVAFADGTNGWMAAGGSCTGGACADPIMRHTTDGGRTWTVWPSVPAVDQVPIDAQTQRSLGALVVLQFAGPLDGWYGQGGQLWSTHDGGHTWHHLDLGGVLGLEPMGETTWAVQTSCSSTTSSTLAAGAPSCPTRLLRTSSASDDWTEADVVTSDGGDLLANDGSLWMLSAGHLWQTRLGFATTIVGPPCAGQPGLSPNRLLDLGPGRIGVLCAATAVDGNTNTMTKVVVQSTDDGARWTRFAVAPATGWAGWAVGNGAGVALVVTDGHTLWRSTGGAWTSVFAPTSPTGEIDQLSMISPSTGFLVADDGSHSTQVLATHDGGLTWTPVPLG